MSIYLRPADARGHANHGWLDSHHTFSFAGYYDEGFMGFGPLRVINEDRVAPGRGFDTHGHRDMEIISYIVDGALEHRDSMGSGGVIRPGDVQVMSAGTGVRHSEFNASKTDPVHFLQIWIIPEAPGLAPRYDQKTFDDAYRHNRLGLVVSGDGRDGSLKINRNVDLYASVLEQGGSASLDLAAGRSAWIQVIRGNVSVNGEQVKAGDGVALWHEARLAIQAETEAEFLVFDLPGLAA